MDVEPQNQDYQYLKAFIIKNNGNKSNKLNNKPESILKKWPISQKMWIFKRNSNHITQMNPKYNILVEIINTIDNIYSHKTPTIKPKWSVETSWDVDTTPYT